MQPTLYVLVSVFAAIASAWRPIGKTRTVRLTQGDVVGMVYESDVPELGPVEVYRGVPYAQAERFMPPSSPARFEWLDAVKNGPVCPQNLVDLDVGMKMGSGRSISGRLAYLRRLIPFLKNQSEDCLNLNIYVPSQAYLNGLGGNLNVIVFIHGESFSWNSGNPYDGSTLASYGNIIFVTLNFRLGVLGFLNTRNNKTTGNFGLLDQIAALRWLKDNIASFGGDPNSITLMGHHTGAIAVNYLMLSPVAQADNGLFQRAILMSGTALSSWAHAKEPEEIAHAVAEETRCPMSDLLSCLRNKRLHDILGVKDLPEDPAPSVDGIVVRVPPKDLMSHNNDLFTRYDLLCGVTESESHHVLDNLALRQGLYNEDVKELLTKFFRENYEHWEQSQERAMKVYSLDKPFMDPIEGRDKTLTLLSDARVVAPMVQTAVFHSTPGLDDIRTYLYVFSHRSKHGDDPLARMSVQGEDLAYVLGVPIEGGVHHFTADYSQEEKHLSETMMSLWINFAKTGNPNLPRRKNYLTKGQSDWALEDVDWPAFEPNSQQYYQIQIPPRIESKYRDNLMHFWNYFLPTWIPTQAAPNKYTTSTKIEPEFKEYPRKPPQRSELDWSMFPPWRATRKPYYGILVTPKPMHTRPPAMDDAPPTAPDGNEDSPINSASSFTFSIVIIVGICFLVINIFLFAYVWYQKKKLRKERRMARYRRGSSPSIELEKREEKCELKSILKSNERLYDPMKVKASQLGKWTGLYSHGSSSTVTIDPHTKVSQWIRSEKGSIGSKTKTDKSSDTAVSAATTSKANRNKVKKVSVAVDATPSARSASVLKQTPIELTKSMDFGKKRLGSALKPVLQRSEALESDEEIMPSHSHSNSDPVQLLSTDVERRSERNLKTFEPSPSMNAYSRDERDEGFLSADEALDNIKRRNYPKVLPDFPSSPSSSEGRLKRMSLPVATPVIDCSKKIPPPPPPRITTATISRHPRTRMSIPSFSNPHLDSHGHSDKEERSDREENTQKKTKDEKRKEKKIEKRPEPRVIIKPTLTDPNQKKINSKIPRVTNPPDTPKDIRKSIKEVKSGPKTKPLPKKASTTEAAGNTSGTSGSSSVSSIATVRKAQKE